MKYEDRILDYASNKRKYIHTDYDWMRYGQYNGVTVKEAEKFLGTTELRKAISNLRASGYKITDVWERGENRFGQKTSYKRYFIHKKTEKEAA